MQAEGFALCLLKAVVSNTRSSPPVTTLPGARRSHLLSLTKDPTPPDKQSGAKMVRTPAPQFRSPIRSLQDCRAGVCQDCH